MSGIDYEVKPHVPLSEPLMIELDRALTKLDAHTPLQFFRWTQQVTPTSYDYRIRSVGPPVRDFTQVYDYADPNVPAAELPAFSTSGGSWSKVEIDLHRNVRSVLMLIVAKYGVTTLRVTFT